MKPKTMTFRPDQIDWLEKEAWKKHSNASELVRTLIDCYREHKAEFEHICPSLKAPHSTH